MLYNIRKEKRSETKMQKQSNKIGIVKMPKGKEFSFPLDLLFLTNVPSYYYRVLFWISQYPEYVREISELATNSICSINEADAAVRFWVDNGVIEIMDDLDIDEYDLDNAFETEDDEPEQSVPFSANTATFMQAREDIHDLVERLDPLFKKELGDVEIGILIDMVDYLNLSPEYVVMLIRHCLSIDIESFPEFKNRAIQLLQEDITTEAELQDRIRVEKEIYNFTEQVKSLFNASYRSLTANEITMIESWYKYGYRIDAIRKAYDEAIKYTKKPLISYANKIIERWYLIGALNLEEIERSYKLGSAEFTKQKVYDTFDTDDFFDAAMRRSQRTIEDKK